MKSLGLALLLLALTSAVVEANDRPNVVIVVADDMGWRDTGYRGNKVVKTPYLDAMASRGAQFEYFYPGQQMCSPGRFAILTGRNPCRTGLHHLGAMRPQELTLAQLLKAVGYRTAQFGKWHLGGKETSPAKMGFDRAIWKINYFDLGASLQVNDSKEQIPLKGDTSVAVMELATRWIREQAKSKEPFFAYVCFASPHSPHQATEEFREPYKNLPENKQHFWGEITALDKSVGDLQATLKELGIDRNTIVWFTSDNGGITPESQDPTGRGKMSVGVRTQGLLEWPAVVKGHLKTELPCGHVDMTPTLLEACKAKMPDNRPVDGISLMPLLDGRGLKERTQPLGFMLWNAKTKNFDSADFVADTQGVWVDAPYKLVVNPKGAVPQLYHLYDDPAEKANLAEKHADAANRLRAALDAWRQSVRASYDGKDYPKTR